jgi:osmotically-inducible protein OsmY
MLNVIAAARYGLAIGCLYALPLTVLPAYGEEPGAKAQEPKATPAKPADAPKDKSEPSKEQSKAPEPEAKTPEAKGSPPSTPTPTPTPPPPAKPPDTKPAKPVEPSKDAKPGDKTVEPKGSETKGTPSEPPPAPKPAETKPAEPTKPPPTPIVSIKLALMADPRLFPYELNVDMSGDVATLSGKVGSEAEKTAAAEIAQASEGVKSVTNNLEIVKDLSQILGRKKDEIITQYVKDRFGKSKTLESAHFDVKTEEGVVLLSGKIKFLVIALEAAEAARQVPGVRAVKSDGVHVEGAE